MSDPCCGYFVNGVAGSGCSCACPKVCPPPHCKAIQLTFEVGTPYAQYDIGCKCEPLSYSFDDAKWTTKEEDDNLVPFPTFDKNFAFKIQEDEDEDFVFSLAGSCSIPCSTVTVTITTTACGIEKLGTGISATLRAVGAGVISGTYSGGKDCDLTLDINGGGSSVSVADGDTISVSLTSSTECCSVCLIQVTCTEIPASMRNLIYRASNISRGTKTYLNKYKLMEKIKKLRRR